MKHRAEKTLAASNAFTFVPMMGVVNLFGDMTNEGGASINWPFLSTLGATAAAVSIIAGVGEFLGNSLRSVAGYQNSPRYLSFGWPTERIYLVENAPARVRSALFFSVRCRIVFALLEIL